MVEDSGVWVLQRRGAAALSWRAAIVAWLAGGKTLWSSADLAPLFKRYGVRYKRFVYKTRVKGRVYTRYRFVLKVEDWRVRVVAGSWWWWLSRYKRFVARLLALYHPRRVPDELRDDKWMAVDIAKTMERMGLLVYAPMWVKRWYARYRRRLGFAKAVYMVAADLGDWEDTREFTRRWYYWARRARIELHDAWQYRRAYGERVTSEMKRAPYRTTENYRRPDVRRVLAAG
jgi:hypothetical protein